MNKTMRNTFTLILIVSLMAMLFGSTVEAKDNHSVSKNRPVQLKVMAYNIQHGAGKDGKLNLNRTAQQIRQSGAKIIGLNEVDNHYSKRSHFKDEAKELAKILNMNYVYGPNLNDSPAEGQTHNSQYGNAILSKYPIINSKNHHLTKLNDSEETRGLLEAQVHVSGENLRFYTTHLDPSLDPTTRAKQVKDIHKITSKHKNKILVGDMNTPQKSDDAPELNPLFQQYQDAWTTKHDGDGYTWPTKDPEMRIDYIFVPPEIHIDSFHLNDSVASDHLPISAKVTIHPRKHPIHASGLKKLVDYYIEKEQITNDEAIHQLKFYLNRVHYYEDKGSPKIAVQQLQELKMLLDLQKRNGWMNDDACQTLKVDTEYLIEEINH